MESTGWMDKIYSLCQWISRLAYVNLLWLLFMGIGLFVLGAAPSTAAMFSIFRKWIKGETGIPVFSFFWENYKKEFWKANCLGTVLTGISIVLYLDWRLISSIQGFLKPILIGCLLGVGFLFLVVMIYIFPVYVHYDYKTLQYIKTAFLIGISYPLHTIAMIFSVICVILISIVFNGVGLLFFGSGLSYILMYISNLLFNKISKQYNPLAL
ncbi:YesL family protein [Fredinandcohnia sp. QZ13]|uniref:YesL family protein n=1 Tax=Fredinandcohnia sp. QZ13 TaxID=3073144 RepID=UPI00285358DA|nr:YesL family protein [Fredinandcohnia sp. QZ13]MDR4888380.1 YesL family protein [Fredinandcohnia sp. QZ13]